MRPFGRLRKSFALPVLALSLVACGSKPRPTLVGCLNDAGFLVSGTDGRVSGTTPRGVAFTLTLHSGRPVVDSRGNPSPKARVTNAELRTIRGCIPG